MADAKKTPTPPFILIGNPENRRVTMFQQALAHQGRAPARVVSWLELVTDGARRLADLPAAPALVRIDSAGESFEVERGMLRLGFERARAGGFATVTPEAIDRLEEDRGRILCPRQAHLGFEALLEQLERVFSERPAWHLLNDPSTIAELFDKRRTSRRYAAAGIPVPEFLEGVESPDALRAAMAERGWRSVFVKLSCSSSASCLAVFHAGGGAGEFVMTTTEMASTGWYNSLRVRRLGDRARIDELLGYLLREGSQVERQVPKARLERAFFDCRMLAVAGEPAFTVVRQSRHPITNLHLGGWRGDPDRLRAAAPGAVHETALDSCRRVAALHPGTLQLGVDIMFEAGFRGHRVLEANAFGDLLPRLERDGLDVYGWQVREALARFG
jgi:hypothetical protein